MAKVTKITLPNGMSYDIGAKYDINGDEIITRNLVPTSRTINSKSLASDVTLTASDVGAAPLNSNNKIDNSYLSDRYDYDSTTESIILL